MLTSEAKNWHNHWFSLAFPPSRHKTASQIYSWWDSRKHLGGLLKLHFLLRVSPSDVNLALQNFPIWKSLLQGINRRPVSSKRSGGGSYFTQAEVQNHFVGKLHYEFYHPSIFPSPLLLHSGPLESIPAVLAGGGRSSAQVMAEPHTRTTAHALIYSNSTDNTVV